MPSQLTQVQGSTAGIRGRWLLRLVTPHVTGPVVSERGSGLPSASVERTQGLLTSGTRTHIVSLPHGLFMCLNPSPCHRRPGAEDTVRHPGRR